MKIPFARKHGEITRLLLFLFVYFYLIEESATTEPEAGRFLRFTARFLCKKFQNVALGLLRTLLLPRPFLPSFFYFFINNCLIIRYGSVHSRPSRAFTLTELVLADIIPISLSLSLSLLLLQYLVFVSYYFQQEALRFPPFRARTDLNRTRITQPPRLITSTAYSPAWRPSDRTSCCRRTEPSTASTEANLTNTSSTTGAVRVRGWTRTTTTPITRFQRRRATTRGWR